MAGFITFVVFIAGLVLLLRYLRKREVEAFMDADMTDFQLHKAAVKEEAKDPLIAKAEAYAALNPNVVPLEKSTQEDADELDLASIPDPTLYHLKDSPFDEINRHFLTLINGVLSDRFVLLNDVPLADFATSNKSENDYKLQNTRVGFLICDSRDLTLLCGVQLKGAQGGDFIKGVFGDINVPLLEFPLSTDVSLQEVSDQLEPLLMYNIEHLCPKCGDPMTMRKAVKGRNAGAVFWVCTRFPSCRGVVKVDT